MVKIILKLENNVIKPKDEIKNKKIKINEKEVVTKFENFDDLENKPNNPIELDDAQRLKIILDKLAQGKLKNSYGQAIDRKNNECQTHKM